MKTAIYFQALTLIFSALISAEAHAFTSEKIEEFVGSNDKVIIYLESGSMPLSVKGLPHLQKVANELGYKILKVGDPFAPMGESVMLEQESYLAEITGGPVHFPSVVVVKNGKVCGPPVPGYKDVIGYRYFIGEQDRECDPMGFASAQNDFSRKVAALKNDPLKVVDEFKLPSKASQVGYYFRPIDNDWFIYHDWRHIYFFNRKTKEEFNGPGKVDGFPTPDGMFLTIPTPLRFFSLEEIFNARSESVNLLPKHSVTGLRDEYQSIGLLNTNGSTRTYRALTAWRQAGRYQDVQWDADANTWKELGPDRRICSSSFALPIISKDGRFIGGAREGKTVLLSVSEDGTECEEVWNLGYPTSKVMFSKDNSLAVFVVDNDKLVLFDMRTGESKVVFHQENGRLVFPSFLENGNIVVMRVYLGYTIFELELP